MQLLNNISAFALLLAAVAKAAPATTINARSPGFLFMEKRDSINDCGSSTFENQTSDASPSVSDCQQIAANISGGGTWTISGLAGYQHQLVQYGSCAFGVEIDPSFGDGPIYYVGNQDIIDLINDSVAQFQWNGLVGSKGVMTCQVAGDCCTSILWGLYHT